MIPIPLAVHGPSGLSGLLEDVGLGVRTGLQMLIVLGALALLVFAWRAWVAWTRLRRVLYRDWAPGAMGSAEALAATVALVREARTPSGNGAPPRLPHDLPAQDRAALAECAGRIFAAIALGDVTPVCDRLTRELYEQLQARCAEGHHVAPAALRSVEVTAAWRERDREQAIVRLIADVPGCAGPREEHWAFVRPAGDGRWKAARIEARPTL